MNYCHVSAQCDEYARQLSAEQAAEDAVERQMDGVHRDYGWRIQELGQALKDVISEDDIGECLAVHRMSNPRPPQPPAPKIDPKHRLTVSVLFSHRVVELADRAATDVDGICEHRSRELSELFTACADLFGRQYAKNLQSLYNETLAAELQLRSQKEGEDQ